MSNLNIKVVVVDSDSGEQLVNEDFKKISLMINYMELFQYELEQRLTYQSEVQEND